MIELLLVAMTTASAVTGPGFSLDATPPADVTRQLRTPADATADEAEILRLEEEFRLAKVGADLQMLNRLFDPTVVSTNQNGNTRNKAQLLELWTDFRIRMLTLDQADVRIVGDLATVTGRQTELNATGTDRMLFTRLWRRAGDTWTLVSITQFRDPRARAAIAARGTLPVGYTARLQWDLFRNDVLLGRPLITLANMRPGTMALPDGTTIRLTLAGVEGDSLSLDLLHSRPNGPRVATPRIVLNGTEPGEFAWTYEDDNYRLRISTVSLDEMGLVTPAGPLEGTSNLQ